MGGESPRRSRYLICHRLAVGGIADVLASGHTSSESRAIHRPFPKGASGKSIRNMGQFGARIWRSILDLELGKIDRNVTFRVDGRPRT
jgi:hypothetical protein